MDPALHVSRAHGQLCVYNAPNVGTVCVRCVADALSRARGDDAPHLGGAPAACWGASRRLSTTTTATLATTRARFARALAALLRDHAVGLDVISSWGHALVPAAVDALSRGDDDDDLSSVLREVCVLLSSATTHGVDDGAALDAVVERALMHLADKERAISKNGGVFGGVGGARTPATKPPSRLASCGGLGFGDRAPPPGGLFLGGGGMSQDWSGRAGSASGSGVGSGRSSESQPTTQTCVGLRPSPGHALAARQPPATFSFSNAASAAAAAGAGAGDGERGGGGGGGGGDEDVARGRLLHLLADLLAMSARRGVLPATFQPRQIAAAAPVPAASSLSSQTLSLSQPGPGGFSQGFPQLSPPTSSQADEYASLGIVPAHVRRVSGANECAPHPLVSLSQHAARSTAAATVKNHPRASSPGVAVVLDALGVGAGRGFSSTPSHAAHPGQATATASSAETRYRALTVLAELLNNGRGPGVIDETGTAHGFAVGAVACALSSRGRGVGGGGTPLRSPAPERRDDPAARVKDATSIALRVLDALATRVGLDLAALLSNRGGTRGGGGGGFSAAALGGGDDGRGLAAAPPPIVRFLRDALLSQTPTTRAAACDCVKVLAVGQAAAATERLVSFAIPEHVFEGVRGGVVARRRRPDVVGSERECDDATCAALECLTALALASPRAFNARFVFGVDAVAAAFAGAVATRDLDVEASCARLAAAVAAAGDPGNVPPASLATLMGALVDAYEQNAITTGGGFVDRGLGGGVSAGWVGDARYGGMGDSSRVRASACAALTRLLGWPSARGDASKEIAARSFAVLASDAAATLRAFTSDDGGGGGGGGASVVRGATDAMGDIFALHFRTAGDIKDAIGVLERHELPNLLISSLRRLAILKHSRGGDDDGAAGTESVVAGAVKLFTTALRGGDDDDDAAAADASFEVADVRRTLAVSLARDAVMHTVLIAVDVGVFRGGGGGGGGWRLQNDGDGTFYYGDDDDDDDDDQCDGSHHPALLCNFVGAILHALGEDDASFDVVAAACHPEPLLGSLQDPGGGGGGGIFDVMTGFGAAAARALLITCAFVHVKYASTRARVSDLLDHFIAPLTWYLLGGGGASDADSSTRALIIFRDAAAVAASRGSLLPVFATEREQVDVEDALVDAFTAAMMRGHDDDRARAGEIILGTLVPVRPRSRGGRRSLRTLPGDSLHPPHAFNLRLRCLSTPTDAFQLHPDIRSYKTTLSLRRERRRRRRALLPVAPRPVHGRPRPIRRGGDVSVDRSRARRRPRGDSRRKR